MKRALFLGLALGFCLALVLSPAPARAALPPGEFSLMLRLNGSPSFIGHTKPGADAGTSDKVDAGPGNVVKTQCYSAACVCPGAQSCTCGNVAGANVGTATTGEYVPANGVVYSVVGTTAPTAFISTAPASGSLLLDGGAGAECDHWLMQ